MAAMLPNELKNKSYDVVIGIPSYNNETTISHVAKIVDQGVQEYFNGKGLIVNADGGSKDETMERFLNQKTASDKIAYIYEGVAGKGSAMGSVMKISSLLETSVTIFVDSDLRSIENRGGWNGLRNRSWAEKLHTSLLIMFATSMMVRLPTIYAIL